MASGFEQAGFQDVWSPVALARELKRKPLAIQVAGEPVVLFRGKDGKPAALLDRCPHRGVALSLGKVEDGCLTCPFHSWRFAADGACVKVPLNAVPEGKLRLYGATAFPVRERSGLIWLYTRPGVEAPDEPYLPTELEDARQVHWQHAETWNTHWTRAMENMLDVPHLPYIHRRTIGRSTAKMLKPDSIMDLDVASSPTGWRMHWSVDGERSPARMDWNRPNGMVLHVPIPKRKVALHIWCVPVDATHTRLIVTNTRDFGRYNPLTWLFDQAGRLIILEDKAVVESSRPMASPPVAEERSVISDKATLAFRQWYLARLPGAQPGRQLTSTVMSPGALQ